MADLQVHSPYDGHLIETVPMCSEAEAMNMLQTAYDLSSSPDNQLPLPERAAILERAAAIVEERSEEYASKSAEEGGKPLTDSRVELARAAAGIRVAVEHLRQMPGTEIPMGLGRATESRMAYTFREPIGVVAAVSAFNHPFNLIIHQVIPAVAVGCPVIVKPAGSTPLSCINVAKVLYEAGLPEEWCQVAVCRSNIAEKIVTDPRVAFFSFIGSGKVGWYLRSKLAPGTRCALEHGGVAPVIVEADADLDDALPLLAKGGFYHAGQVCISVQRVFVDASIAKKVADGLTEIAKGLVVGDPVEAETEVGPLITEAEVDRVAEWVEEARAAGAEILCGGEKISNTCYAPTVIYNPPEDAKVTKSEIFGPVICVYPYKNRAEAIARANSLPYSFQASIFTKNIDVAFDSVKRINAAAVMVNDHTAFRVDWMPFGGRKESGIGVGGIPYAMHELTEEKLFVIRMKQ